MPTYGLDLSSHNGSLVFGPIKNAGNSFVIIRAGYGWSVDQKDRMFDTYYNQAKAAGVKVGAYWYSYARSIAEAQAEAICFLEVIKGKKFEMPVYIDMEDADGWKAANGNPSGAMQAQITNTFMQIVQDAGYYVGIYASRSWLDGYLAGLSNAYTKWVADWGTNDGLNHGTSDGADMHQYTSVYSLGGKRFDRNVCYRDFESEIKANGLNGFGKPEDHSDFDVVAWANSHVGKFVDPDGVYGYQCVDVFKQLLLDIGVADGAKPLGGDGYAHQIWYRFSDQGYDQYFDKIPAGSVQPGDVVIFAKGGDTPASHVGICITSPKNGRMDVFGQNQNGPTIPGTLGSGGNVVNLSASSLMGGLRLKGMKKDLEEKPHGYVYRLYNPNSGDHLYTQNYDEGKSLVKAGWNPETGWMSSTKGDDVYRLYDGKFHTYAIKGEHDALVKSGWKSEGVAFKSQGLKPIFRLYNPNSGAHVLTIERKEHNALSAAGWYCEGQDFRGN